LRTNGESYSNRSTRSSAWTSRKVSTRAISSKPVSKWQTNDP
jgi:hypothetical protein